MPLYRDHQIIPDITLSELMTLETGVKGTFSEFIKSWHFLKKLL